MKAQGGVWLGSGGKNGLMGSLVWLSGASSSSEAHIQGQVLIVLLHLCMVTQDVARWMNE